MKRLRIELRDHHDRQLAIMGDTKYKAGKYLSSSLSVGIELLILHLTQ